VIETIGCDDAGWVEAVAGALGVDGDGVIVVEGVLGQGDIERGVEELERAYEAHRHAVGERRLSEAGERGVVRVPMLYRPWFYGLFEVPEVIAAVDRIIGPTAVCHLQNGFVNRPDLQDRRLSTTFQQSPHQDFPRYLNGFVASVNTFFALTDFTAENGATRVLRESHQRPTPPGREEFEAGSVPVSCSAGAMVVFDSTLWHAAGSNDSAGTRYAVNHQWTRSYFKQQIDYVRAVGDDVIETLPVRTQQMLGWHTRVVTSMDEYYRSPEQRLYRSGQG